MRATPERAGLELSLLKTSQQQEANLMSLAQNADIRYKQTNQSSDSNAAIYVSKAHQLSLQGRFIEAEASCRTAIALDGNRAIAYNNLGWAREMQGDSADALFNYQHALQLDPSLTTPRRNLARLLVRLGRRDESLPFWQLEFQSQQGLAWFNRLVVNAMQQRNLSLAGEYASILAQVRFASPWYPKISPKPNFPHIKEPDFNLTIPKLLHDLEQFEYLQERGILSQELKEIIANYRKVVDRLTPLGLNVRVPLSGDYRQLIGDVYNRILHIRDTPRVDRALSNSWDRVTIEAQYLERAPGIVVIDDFLSAQALEGLRLFCLESTVWSGNRYAHGRLGAFLRDGFNCPLLLQIAEELRDAFPHVIGDHHPLRQLWGFKNGHTLPADSTTHADFAAVNVNFWITPTEANLDASSGGLIVYDVDAPLEWDFETYNNRKDIIKPFLKQQNARALNIPYRQNRAIIFNSDLFHATAALHFRPGYENRRINVTMLYGDRENDQHHRELSARSSLPDSTNRSSAWRSASFSKVRHSQNVH